MPTFRDREKNVYSILEMAGDRTFNDWLIENRIVILQKAHFVNENGAEKKKESRRGGKDRIMNIQNVPAQMLLAASDLLITDYSSCFFDYLLLDRPIIHFLYDYDYYAKEDRGLYMPLEKAVCGPIVTEKKDLPLWIMKSMENPGLNRKLRKRRRKTFLTYESEESCRNICEEVLRRAEKRGKT